MMPPTDIVLAAQASARKWAVPASVTLAQWALESGWGEFWAGCRNTPPVQSFNYFGIKAEAGQPSVLMWTHEVVDEKMVSVQAPFRVYANAGDAFDDHGRLLATNPRYDAAMCHTDDPDAFAQALTGWYATDPHYGDKLCAIMHGSANLVQYDAPPPLPPAIAQAA